MLFFYREWNREVEKERQSSRDKKDKKSYYVPSLLKALLKVFGFDYALFGVFCFVEEIFIRYIYIVIVKKIYVDQINLWNIYKCPFSRRP